MICSKHFEWLGKTNILLLVALVVIVWSVWLTSRFLINEDESIYVPVLFAIPLILQVLAIIKVMDDNKKDDTCLRGFYCLLSGVSWLFMLLGWTEYNWECSLARKKTEDLVVYDWVTPFSQHQNRIFISTILMLLASIILISAVFWVTRIIIHARSKPSDPESSDLATRIVEYPFGAICYFLSVFACVTYLLSFAFAFDDCYERTNPKGPGFSLCMTKSLPDNKNPENNPPLGNTGKVGRDTSRKLPPTKR